MFSAISSFSLNDLQPSTGTGIQSNTPGAATPRQAHAPVSQGDTVKLSVTQQVRNLHSEGEGPGQIASSLGLTPTQVNGDLYVSLTWPQLLSKVASSSFTLGGAPSDAATAVSPATGTAASAASIFHPSQSAPAPAAAKPEPKGTSAPDPAIFPAAKDVSAASGAPASQDAAIA